jgi:membrane-associated protein
MVNQIIQIFLYLDQYLGGIIKAYGIFVYFLLFFVIFLETGFVIIPFLPGDSLLFVAGTFAATGALNLYVLLILFSLAAIIGDSVNYFVGNYFGVKVFSKFINKKYMDKTKDFYHQYGAKTIVISRFVPIIRSMAPFVAGMGKMDYKKFLVYNVVGGIAWVAVFVFGGYFFGTIPIIKNHLTISIIIIVILSTIPAVIEFFKFKKMN